MKRLLLVLVCFVALTSRAYAQDWKGQTYSLSTSQLCQTLELPNMGTGVWQVTAIAGATMTFSVSTLDTTALYQTIAGTSTAGVPASTTTTTGAWAAGVAGYRFMRSCIDAGTATVRMHATATGGGSGSGGGGGGGVVTGTVNVTFDGNTLKLHATGDSTIPYLMPTIAYNEDGTVAQFGTLNYHNNAALVSQDGVVTLCKSDPGVPTALSFDTNLSWLHCNDKGDQFVVPAVNGTALFGAAAALADNTANPTLTKIATYPHYLDPAGTWDRWPGYAPCSQTIIRSDNTNNDDETEIKSTAGVICGITGWNAHASTNAYVRCTNAVAASTTPGSTAVIYDEIIPFSSGMIDTKVDVPFATALTCYLATGKAVTDATDPGLDDVVVMVRYR